MSNYSSVKVSNKHYIIHREGKERDRLKNKKFTWYLFELTNIDVKS